MKARWGEKLLQYFRLGEQKELSDVAYSEKGKTRQKRGKKIQNIQKYGKGQSRVYGYYTHERPTICPVRS